MELIFATHNQHKTEEAREIAASSLHIKNLKDIGCFDEIPETADTLEGNALQKARFVHERYQVDCFADDTGLEVEALDGRPGIYSARFAGEHCTYQDNVKKLLEEMKGKTNRKACFRTVVALILNGNEYTFEGRVDGEIIENQRGTSGFGYDPVFVPQGFTHSFAEMTDNEKNIISHRGKAMRQMMNFLKKIK